MRHPIESAAFRKIRKRPGGLVATCSIRRAVRDTHQYRRDRPSFMADVADDVLRPPDWTELAVGRLGHSYRLVAMHEFVDSNRITNAKGLLRYGFRRRPLGDRVRIFAALDEMGSLTAAEALSAFREGRPMACLAALILQGFLEVDLDHALIGPEAEVRRIRQ